MTYQAVVYSVRNLPYGPHTVAIRLTTGRNPAASSPYLITLDAFDVVEEPPAVSTSASSPLSIAMVAVLSLSGVAVAITRRKPLSA